MATVVHTNVVRTRVITKGGGHFLHKSSWETMKCKSRAPRIRAQGNKDALSNPHWIESLSRETQNSLDKSGKQENPRK